MCYRQPNVAAQPSPLGIFDEHSRVGKEALKKKTRCRPCQACPSVSVKKHAVALVDFCIHSSLLFLYLFPCDQPVKVRIPKLL